LEIRQAFLIFEIGPYRCAIPCEQTQEVVPLASTLTLPGQPSLLGGFLNLRGSQVPVVLLRRLFGLPPEAPSLYTPLIVAKLPQTELPSTLLGLCVDRVLGVEDRDDTSLKPLPEDHSLNDCAEAEFEEGGEKVSLLNLKRLLLSEERKRLEELSAESRRRVAEIEASRQS
jgi:purine-binding chemotaxis protein CheW